MFTMVNFQEWLDAELDKRGWTRAELARRAGVHQSSISMVYSGQRNVGPDLANAIGQALSVPASDVLRAAGVISQKPDESGLEEFNLLLSQLPNNERENLLRYMRFLIGENERRTDSGGMETARARG